MATEMKLFEGGVPAYLKSKELDEVTKSLLGSGSTSKRISIRGGVWRLMSGGEEIAKNEDRAMAFVIVNAAPKTSRSYYDKAYDPASEVAVTPTCWSSDSDKPDPSVENPPAPNCATCPMNVKGSGQGESRACRFNHRVAVVLENDLDGDVYQLVLPAASIFGDAEDGKMPLNAYVKFLAGFNVPVTAVVTEARFDTNAATPKLTFKALRPLSEADYLLCIEKGKSHDAIQAITFAPPKKKDETKALAAPADEADGGEDKGEEKVTPESAPAEPAPTKRASKTQAPPPEPKKTAAELLAQWDDD